MKGFGYYSCTSCGARLLDDEEEKCANCDPEKKFL